jgi:molecular chaperone GrpE
MTPNDNPNPNDLRESPSSAQPPGDAPPAVSPAQAADRQEQPDDLPAQLSLAQARLAEAQAKLSEMSDAYLRAKAETDNVRRRADDEIGKARKFAVEGFAESLLPVKDSLEAAIAVEVSSPQQMLEGVHATLRQLVAALERNRVLEVSPAVGTKFDPHQHQAISMVSAEQDANTVVAVLQKGYLISDRVLRPALVTVAAPK